MLQLACAWADVHDIDSSDPHYQPLIERACIFGGDGTPEVAEHCVAEFGVLQQQGLWAGRLMIADALDLRHRLPELWRLVQAGSVRAWAARKVAQATRDLSYDACRDLDRSISQFLTVLPWGRFAKILHATILELDPQQAAERTERDRTKRDVWATESEDGLKLLIARAASGMWPGSWPRSTGSPTSSPSTATPTRSAPGGRKRSASSPNPPTRYSCWSTTSTTPTPDRAKAPPSLATTSQPIRRRSRSRAQRTAPGLRMGRGGEPGRAGAAGPGRPGERAGSGRTAPRIWREGCRSGGRTWPRPDRRSSSTSISPTPRCGTGSAATSDPNTAACSPWNSCGRS